MRRNEAATLRRYNEQSKCVEKSKWHQCCKEIKTKSKENRVFFIPSSVSIKAC